MNKLKDAGIFFNNVFLLQRLDFHDLRYPVVLKPLPGFSFGYQVNGAQAVCIDFIQCGFGVFNFSAYNSYASYPDRIPPCSQKTKHRSKKK